MITKREIVRKFIRAMEWATPRNLVLLLDIKETAVRVMLSDMIRIKDPRTRLAKVQNKGGHSVYYLASNKNGGTIRRNNIFYHDVEVRNIAATIMRRLAYENLDRLTVKDFAIRGKPDFGLGGLYVEVDTGKFDLAQLEQKIRNNYSHDGNYIVIFFMQNEDGLKHLEASRVDKVLQAAEEALGNKKGRIYACGYLGYLEDNEIIRNINGNGLKS